MQSYIKKIKQVSGALVEAPVISNKEIDLNRRNWRTGSNSQMTDDKERDLLSTDNVLVVSTDICPLDLIIIAVSTNYEFN